MDTQARQELETLVAQLRRLDDPRSATPQWKAALNLLRKSGLDQNRVANIVARRSVAELAELVGQLQAPASAEPAPPEVDEQALASAMKAFRKRLKLMRLDDESRVNSRNPLTSGQRSPIRSIQPPQGWPREVWETLARRGKLRSTGRGFYELVEEDA